MTKAHIHKLVKCLVPDLPTPEELLPYLRRIHDNRWYSNFGELSKEFTCKISKLLSTDTLNSNISACLTSSATQSLELALASLNLQQGKGVLLPSLTFPASATAIIKSGLTPLFADINADSWQLTPEIAYDAAKRLEISVVMPVATFGSPVETTQWDKFQNDTGIPVIIDASGAFPFQRIAKDCLVIFSFHATKAFGIGEGGGIFTTNQLLIEKLRRASNFGFHNGVLETVGCNAKMSEYHAAVALAQLARWPSIQERRKNINGWYQRLLLDKTDQIEQQQNHIDYTPSLKVIKVPLSANSLLKSMKSKGIECRQWYCPPLHHHPALLSHGKLVPMSFQLEQEYDKTRPNYLETTDKLSAQLLGIPFHNFLSVKDIQHISNCLLSEIEPPEANQELHGKSKKPY